MMQHRFWPVALSILILAAGCPPHALALNTPAGTIIPAAVEVTYVAGNNSMSATASVSSVVAQNAGVIIHAGAPPQSVSPGQACYTLLTITNCGNGTDFFLLSASSASGWPADFVRDDNNDGVHQQSETTKITTTGSLAADASIGCFLCVTVPGSATTGDTVTTKCTSGFAPSALASASIAFPAPAAHSVAFAQMPAAAPTAILSGGSTACSALAVDSLGHSIVYQWSDGGSGGRFAPSASVQNPVYTAPQNLTTGSIAVNLTCTASCAQSGAVCASGSASVSVAAQPPVVVTPIPGDFTGDRVVDSADVSLFNKEWLRCHRSSKAKFNASVDGIYDLAPRATGAWPDWTPIGDKSININDATAFVECLTKSPGKTLSYKSNTYIYRATSLMLVSAVSAPNGIYQVSVALPSGVVFGSSLDGSGNLSRVLKGSGAGSILYSEYDAATRTIRITGTVTGSAPYMVALIYLGY